MHPHRETINFDQTNEMYSSSQTDRAIEPQTGLVNKVSFINISFQIRVNSLNPGLVMTELAKRVGWGNPEQRAKLISKIPLGHSAGESFTALSITLIIAVLFK